MLLNKFFIKSTKPSFKAVIPFLIPSIRFLPKLSHSTACHTEKIISMILPKLAIKSGIASIKPLIIAHMISMPLPNMISIDCDIVSAMLVMIVGTYSINCGKLSIKP